MVDLKFITSTEEILALEDISDPESSDFPRTFIAVNLAWLPVFGEGSVEAHGLYGGQAIAQSCWAACQTVPEGFDLHSTHGHFLRPGNAVERICYRVYDVRSGRGYATRRVEALQFDKAIYTCFASFKTGFSTGARDAPVIQHGIPYPKDLPPYHQIENTRPCPDVDMPLLLNMRSRWKMPLDFRKLDLVAENRKRPTYQRRQVHYFKPLEKVGNRSHNFQAVLLLYGSDRNFLFTATNAHAATNKWMRYNKVTSLDHAVVFHCALAGQPSTPDGEDWITYQTSSPASGNQRCLVTGHMWDIRRRHVATVMQEAMADVEYNTEKANL